MGLLGHEQALSVRRSRARRLEEFSAISWRDARAVLFRRSLGDAPGGRPALRGLCRGQAGDPHHGAGRRRSEQDRPFRILSSRASRHAVARRGGMDRGGGVGSSSVLVREPKRILSSPGLTGRSSTPRPLDSIISASGILGRPPSRAMTAENAARSSSCYVFAIPRRVSPELCKNRSPNKQRAQGMPGAPCTRSLVCREKSIRVSRFTGVIPAFPAQWFYGLLRALLGDHAF